MAKKKVKSNKKKYLKPLYAALLFGVLGSIWLLATHALSTAWDASKSYNNGDVVSYSGRDWKATKAIGANQPPLGSGDGSVADRNLLLSRRAGFGANVTGGGTGGSLVHVTNANDSGAGSLRAAVTGNNAAWVVFDGDYTITLSTGINVGSNKTIDGRGRNVTISAPGQNGFLISGVSNIIIENLIMTKFGDFTKRNQNNTPDAIGINGSSHDIWIDHNTLSEAGDKLIGITGGNTNITVSWNHFYETQAQFAYGDAPQVFQIGTQTNGDAGGTGLDVNQTVTIHHNFFEDNGYRHPVLGYGKAHAYNNYLYHWGAFGMKAERTGQLYAEKNVFEAGSNTNAILNKPADDGCNDTGKFCDSRLGYVKGIENLLLGGAIIKENEPGQVFDPHKFYGYTVDSANSALTTRLKTYTGPQTAWQISTGSTPPNTQPPSSPPPSSGGGTSTPPDDQTPPAGDGSSQPDDANDNNETITPPQTATGAPVKEVQYAIDGNIVKITNNSDPVTLDTSKLAPGDHEITATTIGADGSLATKSKNLVIREPSLLHQLFHKYIALTISIFVSVCLVTFMLVWRLVLQREWPAWLLNLTSDSTLYR